MRESNNPITTDDENGGNREPCTLGRTRNRGERHALGPVRFFVVGGHAKRDSEGGSNDHVAVRNQLVRKMILLGHFGEAFGGVGTDRDNLGSGGEKLRLDFGQSGKLTVAIGTPTTPIKNHDRRLSGVELGKIDGGAVGSTKNGSRSSETGRQRTNLRGFGRQSRGAGGGRLRRPRGG